MGLDMYLRGDVHLFHDWDHPEKDLKRDGFRVSDVTLELGYWRKHPDLHGFIVQTFADGKDECQEIPLTAENLVAIIEAIKNKELPKTGGFFFGESDGSEDAESIATFEAAIKWLEKIPAHTRIKETVELGAGMVAHVIDLGNAEKTKEMRRVVYRASW